MMGRGSNAYLFFEISKRRREGGMQQIVAVRGSMR